MIEEMLVELEALKQRENDLCFLLIEAEGEHFFSYATELEFVQYEIETLERRVNNYDRSETTS